MGQQLLESFSFEYIRLDVSEVVGKRHEARCFFQKRRINVQLRLSSELILFSLICLKKMKKGPNISELVECGKSHMG